jgi:hypothetical protein
MIFKKAVLLTWIPMLIFWLNIMEKLSQMLWPRCFGQLSNVNKL